MEVWAGDIELDCRNAIRSVQLLRYLQILLYLLATDVDNYRDIKVAKIGQLFINKSIHTDILQPDRVEHPRRCLKDSRHRISRPRYTRDPFDNHRTKLIQVNEVHVLATIAESPRRGHNGIFHLNTGDMNFK